MDDQYFRVDLRLNKHSIALCYVRLCVYVCLYVLCAGSVYRTRVYACMFCVRTGHVCVSVCFVCWVYTGHVCVCLFVLCAGCVYRTRVCMPVCFVCTRYITILGLAT